MGFIVLYCLVHFFKLAYVIKTLRSTEEDHETIKHNSPKIKTAGVHETTG